MVLPPSPSHASVEPGMCTYAFQSSRGRHPYSGSQIYYDNLLTLDGLSAHDELKYLFRLYDVHRESTSSLINMYTRRARGGIRLFGLKPVTSETPLLPPPPPTPVCWTCPGVSSAGRIHQMPEMVETNLYSAVASAGPNLKRSLVLRSLLYQGRQVLCKALGNMVEIEFARAGVVSLPLLSERTIAAWAALGVRWKVNKAALRTW